MFFLGLLFSSFVIVMLFNRAAQGPIPPAELLGWFVAIVVFPISGALAGLGSRRR